MKMNLSVEGRILSSVYVDASRIDDENYLKAFRRLLTIRHQKKLLAIKKEPCFYLEHQPGAFLEKSGPLVN
jgi:hypothetical protein